MRQAFAATLCWSLLAGTALAAEYHVGPDQPVATPERVPWESLQAGDTVLIHWRAEPYRSKWAMCCRGTAAKPITVRGIPGPGGELPVLDGRNALAPTSYDYPGGSRGVIKVGWVSNVGDVLPAWIVIENLDIRSARPGFRSISLRGVQDYSDAASAIYVERGEHITVRNCILHDCANGFFTACDTSEILLENCAVYDNGMEGSIYQHNLYTESNGMVMQANHFGLLRPGCRGNNIKDRSSGLVVRFNWIEGGNRQLDLVDAEDSPEIRDDLRYNTAYVYCNVLIEPEGAGAGNNQIVHFGGDNGAEEEFRLGPLYFFHNTVVSHRAEKTTLLRLSSNSISARVFNNVIYTTAPGRFLSILDETGLVELSNNVIRPGWRDCHGDFLGSIEAANNIEVDDFGFADFAQHDLRPTQRSPATDREGRALPPRHALLYEPVAPRGARARDVHGLPDFGAFEAAP